MSYKQLVVPRLGTRDNVGWCLRFTQTVFSAPAAHPSARIAWDHQKGRHSGTPPLGIAVPIWLDHWGTYGEYAGTYDNWGHTAAWLGDGRILSSPMNPSQGGQVIFNSIAEMQAAIGGNPKLLGWSEYMNEKQIVRFVSTPKTSGGTKKMFMIHTDAYMKDENRPGYRWAIVGAGFWQEIHNKDEAHAARKALGVPDMIKVDGPRYRSYRAASYAAMTRGSSDLSGGN